MKLKLQRKFDQMTETKTKIREAFVDISSLIHFSPDGNAEVVTNDCFY